MEKIKVAVVRAENYENLDAAVKEAMELAEFSIEKDARVLLKPNIMSDAAPDSGLITNPRFVKAVAEYVRQYSANIKVGDCSSKQSFEGTAASLKAAGLKETLQGSAEVVNLDSDYKWVMFNNRYADKIMIAKGVMDSEVLITVPKLKTHIFTFFTGAVKNLYGCVYGVQKQVLHSKIRDNDDFSKMHLELYQLLKPKFAIMDAIDVMEGDGPSAGPIRRMGLIIASRDALALDYVAVRLAGFKPGEVPLLKVALREGILDADRIEVVGLPIEKAAMHLRAPSTLAPGKIFGNPIFRLSVDESKCIKCGACEKICPVKAVRLNPYPTWDEGKCIKCFCCHEACLQKAIVVKKERSKSDLMRAAKYRAIGAVKKLLRR